MTAASSTLLNNTEGRNLPSTISLDVVEDAHRQFTTETREFQSNGAPPAFPTLQSGSVKNFG
ncbi:MAG: hypothetical protein GXP21_04930 [Gammaproteobacteria bacterium]|nr:hypothetical protein [Gammaproteobacteria bacterium]